ncbi:hypothetical protein, partial [Streptomyces sp. NPDC005859]|uniref:hypothetical protein n=1 Tax=Streptomyces sp. NPDC005859 TaxID=3157170 RepID=UPI00341061DF
MMPPGNDQGPRTLDDVQAKIGKRLDDVAKILAGALVTVAGVMTALGLTSDVVFVALNNESWPIFVAALSAILAIVCSIVALLIQSNAHDLWIVPREGMRRAYLPDDPVMVTKSGP